MTVEVWIRRAPVAESDKDEDVLYGRTARRCHAQQRDVAVDGSTANQRTTSVRDRPDLHVKNDVPPSVRRRQRATVSKPCHQPTYRRCGVEYSRRRRRLVPLVVYPSSTAAARRTLLTTAAAGQSLIRKASRVPHANDTISVNTTLDAFNFIRNCCHFRKTRRLRLRSERYVKYEKIA